MSIMTVFLPDAMSPPPAKFPQKYRDKMLIVTIVNDNGLRYLSTPLCGVLEGIRMPSNLIDYPLDKVRVGLLVELTFIARNGQTLPTFKPSEGDGITLTKI